MNYEKCTSTLIGSIEFFSFFEIFETCLILDDPMRRAFAKESISDVLSESLDPETPDYIKKWIDVFHHYGDLQKIAEDIGYCDVEGAKDLSRSVDKIIVPKSKSKIRNYFERCVNEFTDRFR